MDITRLQPPPGPDPSLSEVLHAQWTPPNDVTVSLQLTLAYSLATPAEKASFVHLSTVILARKFGAKP